MIDRAYKIQQGDILIAQCEPSVGHEMRKIRPCVVVQGALLNQHSSLITVVPLSSQTNESFIGDIRVSADFTNCLKSDSLIISSQVYTYDRSRFSSVIGRISPKIMKQVKNQLRKNMDLL